MEKAKPNRTASYRPTVRDVEQLIEAARNHPLGVKFMLQGDLGAVAVTFQTHAFTVEAAREKLNTGKS